VIQVGDKVRLVTIPEGWQQKWGDVGAVATVMALGNNNVLVDYSIGYWWDVDCVEPECHADADLAMALELAKLLEFSPDGFDLEYGPVHRWLLIEVRNALLERAQ